MDTYNALMILELVDDEELDEFLSEYNGILVPLLVTGRTLPVYGNERVYEWFANRVVTHSDGFLNVIASALQQLKKKKLLCNTWGDCSCPKCKNITGQNLLGKALMDVRANFAPVEKFDLLVCYDELHPREEIIKDVSNYGVVDNTYYYIKDGKRHVITDRLLVFGRTDFFKK